MICLSSTACSCDIGMGRQDLQTLGIVEMYRASISARIVACSLAHIIINTNKC